jgi:WD40 repeat protein
MRGLSGYLIVRIPDNRLVSISTFELSSSVKIATDYRQKWSKMLKGKVKAHFLDRSLVMLALLVCMTITQPAFAQVTFFQGCSQPLILFTELRSRDKSWLNCVTAKGTKDLRFEGRGFTLSPSEEWIAYTRWHGPYRRFGKEYFGYVSLYIYNLKTKQENRLLTDMGHIIHFWHGSSDALMISFWLNRLGAYEDEYPAHFLYEPGPDRFTEMKWPSGRIIGYFSSENRYLLRDWDNLFTVSPEDPFYSEPFHGLPNGIWTYGIIISPDAKKIAYAGADGRSKILDHAGGTIVELADSSFTSQTRLQVTSFSHSGKYVTVLIDSEILAVYSLEDKQIIYQEKWQGGTYPEHTWLSGTDMLIMVQQISERPYTTDLYSFDATTRTSKRLTNTRTFKSL